MDSIGPMFQIFFFHSRNFFSFVKEIFKLIYSVDRAYHFKYYNNERERERERERESRRIAIGNIFEN